MMVEIRPTGRISFVNYLLLNKHPDKSEFEGEETVAFL
jgi:hypothetical protein